MEHARTTTIVAWLVIAALSACSGGTSGGDDAGDTAAGDAGDTTLPQDTVPGLDTADTLPADTTPPAPTLVGSVNLMTGVHWLGTNPTPDASWSYSASFSDPAHTLPDGVSIACTTTTAGPCESVTCVKHGDWSSVPAATTPNAGPITVSGAAFPITITHGGSAYAPDSADADVAMWSGGETLTATIPGGGGVPAASLSVVGPHRVTVSAPSWPAYPSPLSVSRAAGLALAWNPAGGGDLVVTLSQTDAPALRCTFPIAAGAGTIPAAALGGFAAGGGHLNAMAAARGEVVTGDWRLTLNAAQTAIDPTERAFAGAITLE